MKCEKCGAVLVAGAKFCMMCGTKTRNTCKKCGMELPDVAKFCFNCGAPVGGEVAKPAAKPSIQPVLPEDLFFPDPEEAKPAVKQVLPQKSMQKLSEVKQQVKPVVEHKPTGAPVWDSTPNGTCDCAVGECDCDGSIWN